MARISSEALPQLTWTTGGVVSAFVAALWISVSAHPRSQQAIIFDMVRLNAVVTNPDGVYVTGLGAHDFQLLEDGVEQKIQIFNAPDSPITFAVLVDGSVSMQSWLPTVRLAVRELLRALGPTDFVQIVQFNDRVSVLEDFSARRDALEAAIDRFSSTGRTAVLNALYRALREIEVHARKERDESRRRAIVLLSDGVDSASLVSEDAVLSEARRSRASVYSVSFGRSLTSRLTATLGRGAELLRELSRTTGGRVIEPESIDDLQGAFAQIAEELRKQYGFAYVSDNVARDGQWRQIEMKVRGRPDVRIRHRDGYYAGLASVAR